MTCNTSIRQGTRKNSAIRYSSATKENNQNLANVNYQIRKEPDPIPKRNRRKNSNDSNKTENERQESVRSNNENYVKCKIPLSNHWDSNTEPNDCEPRLGLRNIVENGKPNPKAQNSVPNLANKNTEPNDCEPRLGLRNIVENEKPNPRAQNSVPNLANKNTGHNDGEPRLGLWNIAENDKPNPRGQNSVLWYINDNPIQIGQKRNSLNLESVNYCKTKIPVSSSFRPLDIAKISSYLYSNNRNSCRFGHRMQPEFKLFTSVSRPLMIRQF